MSRPVCLITGGTSGIGRCTALEMRAAGYTVYELSRRETGVEGLHHIPTDVTDEEAVQRAVDEVVQKEGGIDVVINNASHPGMAPFGEMTPDIWNYGIENELNLVYNVCNCAWPYLQKAEGGASIIITASTCGLQGSNSPQACHAAAKGACIAMARQLAAEGGPFGIRCNSVTPGLVWTEAMSNIPKEMATGLIAAQTTQRAIDPMDIAYAYLFLASDESRQITATNIAVDGGCAGAGIWRHADCQLPRRRHR